MQGDRPDLASAHAFPSGEPFCPLPCAGPAPLDGDTVSSYQRPEVLVAETERHPLITQTHSVQAQKTPATASPEVSARCALGSRRDVTVTFGLVSDLPPPRGVSFPNEGRRPPASALCGRSHRLDRAGRQLAVRSRSSTAAPRGCSSRAEVFGGVADGSRYCSVWVSSTPSR